MGKQGPRLNCNDAPTPQPSATALRAIWHLARSRSRRQRDRPECWRSVWARHDEGGVSNVECLRGELRARRWRLPGSWGRTVRSALQEDRQRVAAKAPSGLRRTEWDVNKLVSGSRLDVRRRGRRTSSGGMLSPEAQLQSVVGGQYSRMTRSVGEREAGGEAGVCV